MSKFFDFMTNVRKAIEDNINDYLAGEGLDPIQRFLASNLELGDGEREVAIFPTSSNGNTFSEDGNSCSVRFTVQFYLNEDATEESFIAIEKYYGAWIGFFTGISFGDFSFISDSVIIRMDDGEPVNGAIFSIECRLSSYIDYGYGL